MIEMPMFKAAAIGLLTLLAAAYAPATPTVVARASTVGAHLDSDLLKGGGTDDTLPLQGLLDKAASGPAVHLIIDGPALVSGLNLYGNTTIECTAGAGLYLKDGSRRAILRNAHRSRGAITDEHIEVRGCFLNGNRDHQRLPEAPLDHGDSWKREPDRTFISGLQFFGVNYLTIENVTVWKTLAFGALIANASYVDIHDVIIDDGGGGEADVQEYDNTDGLHFKGPLRYVSIDSLKLRVGDDGIALNANDFETNNITTRNDFGPYVGQGPMSDVTISNITFLPGQISGIRILSTSERIDRIAVNNVTGVVRAFLLEISHWQNPTSFGNVGSVSISNVTVDQQPSVYDKYCFICINGHIATLSLHQITTAVLNNRPLISIGPRAAVGTLDVDLTAIDPTLAGNIVQLTGVDANLGGNVVEHGGRVDHMKLALNWQGSVSDQGKDPITSDEGTITDLQWVGTPPLYVQGHVTASERSSLDVVFTQQLKRPASADGATMTVSGKPWQILGATLRPDGKTIRYKLISPLRVGDTLAWSYDSAKGDLQNLDGIKLQHVSSKQIQR
jgi:hypothetical protein